MCQGQELAFKLLAALVELLSLREVSDLLHAAGEE